MIDKVSLGRDKYRKKRRHRNENPKRTRTTIYYNEEDFTRQTFRAGGNGGQHQNKTDSGVRLIHNDSGAVGVSRDGKSQHANQKTAFQRLVSSDKFKTWHKIKSAEMAGTRKTKKQLLREVEEDICEKNLKIETADIKGGKK